MKNPEDEEDPLKGMTQRIGAIQRKLIGFEGEAKKLRFHNVRREWKLRRNLFLTRLEMMNLQEVDMKNTEKEISEKLGRQDVVNSERKSLEDKRKELEGHKVAVKDLEEKAAMLEGRYKPRGPIDLSPWMLVILLFELGLIICWWAGFDLSFQNGFPRILIAAAILIPLIMFIVLTYITRETPSEIGRKWYEVKLSAPLAVFFGYLIVGMAIGGALILANELQPTQESGWETSTVDDGELFIRFQTSSNLGVSPLQTDNVPIPILVTLGFDGGGEPAFTGNATVTITDMDPPLRPSSPYPPSLQLGNTSREGNITLDFIPTARVEGEIVEMHYEVRYNISAGALGAHSGSKSGVLSLSLKGSEFTSGWYLLFIFSGILTSFWWRVANSYLADKESSEPSTQVGRKNIAKYLLLPFFSFVIALAVFRQFQESLPISNDPLMSAAAGFVYGFFWESASQKFGKTVLSVTGYERGDNEGNDKTGE